VLTHQINILKNIIVTTPKSIEDWRSTFPRTITQKIDRLNGIRSFTSILITLIRTCYLFIRKGVTIYSIERGIFWIEGNKSIERRRNINIPTKNR